MANNRPRNPNIQLNDVEPSFVRKTVSELKEIYNLPPVETDEDVEQRILDFFQFCERTGQRPGVELLTLFLGRTRQTISNWSNGIGCSPERTEMINHCKSLIASFLEQSHLQGEINPVSAIFLSKCWMQYRESDDITLRLNPQTSQIPQQSLTEIARLRHVNISEMPEKPELE